MEYKIKLIDDLKKDKLVNLDYLVRKGERDGLPLSTLQDIDEDGFYVDFTNIDNLNFDNSGNYFESREASKQQIEKVISDIISGRPIKPVIIDTNGNVFDGQHRCCAFKVLGIQNVPIFKSMMNDTVYDNLSTRRIKLNIPFEDDFYTKEELDSLDVKLFLKIKTKASNKMTNTKFKTNKLLI